MELGTTLGLLLVSECRTSSSQRSILYLPLRPPAHTEITADCARAFYSNGIHPARGLVILGAREGRKRVMSCNTTILIRLLDPFESAAHGCVVDAQMCRDLIEPIALFIGLANRFLSPSTKDLLQRRLRSS